MIAAVLLILGAAQAFHVAPSTGAPRTALSAVGETSRRGLFGAAVVGGASIAGLALPAFADEPTRVVVAGATGQTGRRIVERLAALDNVAVIAGVRNVENGAKSLGESSVAVRGAMVQAVPGVDVTKVSLKQLDCVKDSVLTLSETMKGAKCLVIATGFVPGNPFKMDSAAHAVDNLGTIALVDAAKAAGVKKVVLVSSILTNAREWGQGSSPGFQLTNAFGHVLDEKIVAEKYLRASGLDYTIVRPGGLKSTAPTGALLVSGEDTLSAGEVSRDLVADVCAAALFDPKTKNKVIEIVETEADYKPITSEIFASL